MEEQYHWKTNPAVYVPYNRRMVGDADAQEHPEWFTSKDLMKEIKMLLWMNAKYGTHHLRVAAYLKLEQIIMSRTES